MDHVEGLMQEGRALGHHALKRRPDVDLPHRDIVRVRRHGVVKGIRTKHHALHDSLRHYRLAPRHALLEPAQRRGQPLVRALAEVAAAVGAVEVVAAREGPLPGPPGDVAPLEVRGVGLDVSDGDLLAVDDDGLVEEVPCHVGCRILLDEPVAVAEEPC